MLTKTGEKQGKKQGGKNDSLAREDILQHTATHCNTLQHTATHCNTLQHTATNDSLARDPFSPRVCTFV